MKFIILFLFSLNLYASDLSSGTTYHYPQGAKQGLDLTTVSTLELDPYAIYCDQHKNVLRRINWFRVAEDKNLMITVNWTYFYRAIISAVNLDPTMKFSATSTFDSLIRCLQEKMPNLRTIKFIMTKTQTDLASVKKLLKENGIELEEYTVIDLNGA